MSRIPDFTHPWKFLIAIEGLTSPDGRVFGKMAHAERYTPHTWFNAPGEKDMQMFQAGVAYFR